jgi:hypothetical protein
MWLFHLQHNPTPSLHKCGGTRWRSWLSHCATSRKVAVSIPDVVIRMFYWHNPSAHTMALGLTQLLTEMSTRNNSWAPVRRVDNLATFMRRFSWNLGVTIFWNPMGLSRPAVGLLLPFTLHRCTAFSSSLRVSIYIECTRMILAHFERTSLCQFT